MQRYILRRETDIGPSEAEAFDRLTQWPDSNVLRRGPRYLFVAADPHRIARDVAMWEGWTVTEERHLGVPPDGPRVAAPFASAWH
jgi:hypothetical protein